MPSPARDIGLYIYTAEGAMGGRTPRWTDIKDMAQVADKGGFSWITIPDRLQFPEYGFWESTTMLSALAAVTEHVKLTHSVMRSIYRNPALVAKMIDSLDEISGGRFIWGIGAGSTDGDNRKFGYPEDYRFSRFQEALILTLELLKQGRAEHSGRFYTAADCVISPRGPSGGRIPLLMAAQKPKMMNLAARHADYWNIPVAHLDPEDYSEDLRNLETACLKEDRDPASIIKVAGIPINSISGFGDHPFGKALSGDISEVVDTVNSFEEAGFGMVTFWPWPNSPDGVKALLPTIARLKKQ